MKENAKRDFLFGLALLCAFVIWTFLICTADVRAAGVNGTNIGFAAFNVWFHEITGVNMTLYTITDWLGLVPIAVCMSFGTLGLVQLIKRRSLLCVDRDIILLGVYYILVISGYLIFEAIPINYRPVLINGFMEASYPSSTTLLVLSVMPTLVFQIRHRVKSKAIVITVAVLSGLFSIFMVTGRLISGVHWATDIIGSVLLSTGLFLIYRESVLYSDKLSLLKGSGGNGI